MTPLFFSGGLKPRVLWKLVCRGLKPQKVVSLANSERLAIVDATGDPREETQWHQFVGAFNPADNMA
jgi:hypothetical protein